MLKIYTIFICFLCSICTLDAQVNFTDQILSEVDSKKPIFIDFYTDWCGPCKKLDRTTFQDTLLSAYLNENFTCLKWNAEGERFFELASFYQVNSYPTLLFLDKEHNVVNRIVGFRSSTKLLRSSEQVIKYIDEKPLSNIKINELGLEETNEILENLTTFEIKEKLQLFDHLVNLIGDDELLWKKHTDILTLSAPEDLDLEIIKKLVLHVEAVKLGSPKSLETIATVNNKLSSLLDTKLEAAKVEGNYPLYSEISQLKGDLALKGGVGRQSAYNTKQLKIDRLDY